jgi:hypothetical protein
MNFSGSNEYESLSDVGFDTIGKSILVVLLTFLYEGVVGYELYWLFVINEDLSRFSYGLLTIYSLLSMDTDNLVGLLLFSISIGCLSVLSIF